MVSTELKRWRQLRDRINKMAPEQREVVLPVLEEAVEVKSAMTAHQLREALLILKAKLEQPETLTPSEFSLVCELTAWYEARQFEQAYCNRLKTNRHLNQ